MATEMQLLTVASLLRRGRALDQLSSVLSLVALLIGLAPLLGIQAQPLTALFCALLLVLGLGQKYWALRVALDAELFQQLASRVDQLAVHTAELDQTLAQLKLQSAKPSTRSWEERSLGALRLLRLLRLLRQQALWLLAQLLLAVLIVLGLPWFSITG